MVNDMEMKAMFTPVQTIFGTFAYMGSFTIKCGGFMMMSNRQATVRHFRTVSLMQVAATLR